ncbi:MAG: hypothetical protein K5765_08315 [Clostridia bacterium]|nr:hypothetical protein [Clostridia bacterium]
MDSLIMLQTYNANLEELLHQFELCVSAKVKCEKIFDDYKNIYKLRKEFEDEKKYQNLVVFLEAFEKIENNFNINKNIPYFSIFTSNIFKVIHTDNKSYYDALNVIKKRHEKYSDLCSRLDSFDKIIDLSSEWGEDGKIIKEYSEIKKELSYFNKNSRLTIGNNNSVANENVNDSKLDSITLINYNKIQKINDNFVSAYYDELNKKLIGYNNIICKQFCIEMNLIDTLSKAVNGNIDAMVQLAEAYENGNYAKQSNNKAMYWYEKAAVLGNNKAKDKKIEIYNIIKREKNKALKERKKREKKAYKEKQKNIDREARNLKRQVIIERIRNSKSFIVSQIIHIIIAVGLYFGGFLLLKKVLFFNDWVIIIWAPVVTLIGIFHNSNTLIRVITSIIVCSSIILCYSFFDESSTRIVEGVFACIFSLAMGIGLMVYLSDDVMTPSIKVQIVYIAQFVIMIIGIMGAEYGVDLLYMSKWNSLWNALCFIVFEFVIFILFSHIIRNDDSHDNLFLFILQSCFMIVNWLSCFIVECIQISQLYDISIRMVFFYILLFIFTTIPTGFAYNLLFKHMEHID